MDILIGLAPVAGCRGRRLAVALALALMSVVVPVAARADVERVDEYQVKAAFLFNFAKFINWPNADAGRPIVIAIVGEDPFGEAIDEVVRGRNVEGRSFLVRRLRHSDDLGTSDIVFVSGSEERRTPEILARVRPAGVLTVGETPHFVRDGGLVLFYVEGNRVRFQINKPGVERARVRISSQLLSLAK